MCWIVAGRNDVGKGKAYEAFMNTIKPGMLDYFQFRVVTGTGPSQPEHHPTLYTLHSIYPHALYPSLPLSSIPSIPVFSPSWLELGRDPSQFAV